jgi:hypothetical protein
VAAAVAQAVNAIPLINVKSTHISPNLSLNTSSINSTVNGISNSDIGIAVSGNNNSGGTSQSGVGPAALSQASSSWAISDNNAGSAQIRVDSSLRLHNASTRVQNDINLFVEVFQPAIFSMSGNLNWQPNDFFVEQVQQWVNFRPDGPGNVNYIWVEQDFRPSNLTPLNNNLDVNQLNESPTGPNGELLPNMPGYAVNARVAPGSFLLAPGVYQIRWSQYLEEGSGKGLGTPGASDFSATGYYQLNFRTEQQNVPDTAGTVILLGVGLAGLAFAGARFGKQAA